MIRPNADPAKRQTAVASGLDQARGEWLLLAACHNLRKRHGHVGVTGLAALAIN
ncbi:hypothetical protein LAUMK13_00421 [Mycobacterium innocens]|uniref:Transposase DDE domain-containing protein n=1 Tax=Mycobacterium innocens TaxID=2341083 RepID=A0A498PMK8_9MYCO|nr:hypothetical protein LAUMK13_00421 [Mycobacterium innocens]